MSPFASSLVCVFFNAEGEPTDFYRHAAMAIPEIARLGRSTIHLLSTDVRYVPCAATQEIPAGIDSWTDPEQPLASTDLYQQRISVSGSRKGSDFIVGYFLDGRGERYFMPVNVRQDPESRKDCTETITIDFDFADTPISRLQRLNRTTGDKEIIDDSHSMFSAMGNGRFRLVLQLAGGTGDLFKYDTGAPFAGIDLP